MTKYVADAQEELFGTANDQVYLIWIFFPSCFLRYLPALFLFLKTEEFSDENKSIVWFLVKQVRPGMDLSRVVLPTFILEPRSFLEKISDYYYHSDIISE